MAIGACRTLLLLSISLLLFPCFAASISSARTAELLQANGRGEGAKDFNETETGKAWDMHPIPIPSEVSVNVSRRKLGAFQICALCTCCGGQHKLCFPSPCCYSISCNIPNRPFGFCSFTPKACNCLKCHL